MNKVKLQLDDLQVESFAVESDTAGPGTVQGMQRGRTAEFSDCNTPCFACSAYYTECGETCLDTCSYSCPGSCAATCSCDPYGCGTTP